MLGVVLFTDFTFKMYALYTTEYGMDLRSLSLRLKTKQLKDESYKLTKSNQL